MLAFSLPQAHAGVLTKTTKEIAESLLKKGGREVSEDILMGTVRQLDNISAKCGKGALEIIEEKGHTAFRVFLEAGEDAGPYLVRTIKLYGDDALRTAGSRAGRLALREGNETAIRAVFKHGDQAFPMMQRFGDDAASALLKLDAQNGRRLLTLAQDTTSKLDLKKLFPVLRQYGDEAMTFVWKHRKVLASAYVLKRFLDNPKIFIDGAEQLVKGPVFAILNWFTEKWWIKAALALAVFVFAYKLLRRLLPVGKS